MNVFLWNKLLLFACSKVKKTLTFYLNCLHKRKKEKRIETIKSYYRSE